MPPANGKIAPPRPGPLRIASGTIPSVRGVRTAPPSAGEVIAGRYVVERVHAEGGFAWIVAARHLELEETIAIKLLKPDVARDPAAVERFAREAKACARIKSEYVPKIHDVGATLERGPYIVMEFLEGEDLLAVLGSRGPLSAELAAELVLQACEAIACAHAHGIVHRDLKPENLFLTRRNGLEIVKVLDFGISITAHAPDRVLAGTPLYMAPEQLRGRDVGPRADIWSLGAVLYELVSGRTAFGGFGVTEICASVLESEPAPLEGVPRELTDAIARCLAKDPEKRWPSVADLAVALAHVAPKRARMNVERTIAIAQSAGLAPLELTLPSEAAPPPSEPRALDDTPMTQPGDREAPAATRGSIAPSAVAPPAGSRRIHLAAAAVSGAGAVMIAAALGVALTREPAPPPADPAPPPVASPVVSLPVVARTAEPAPPPAIDAKPTTANTNTSPRVRPIAATTPSASAIPSASATPSAPASATPSAPATATPSAPASATPSAPATEEAASAIPAGSGGPPIRSAEAPE